MNIIVKNHTIVGFEGEITNSTNRTGVAGSTALPISKGRTVRFIGFESEVSPNNISIAPSGFFKFKKENITEIVPIPEEATGIDSSAFYDYNEWLTEVSLPDSIKWIDYRVFSTCLSLKSIKVDSNNSFFVSKNGILFDKNISTIKRFPPKKCVNTYDIPDSVTSIGDFAFAFCTSLKNITITDNITSIGDYAFSACTSLETITVDSGNSAYLSSDGVLFNKNKTDLVCYPAGKAATDYTIPDTVAVLRPFCFGLSSLRRVTIHDNVTSIGDAFCGCDSLVSITIPHSVTSIDKVAFEGCNPELVFICPKDSYADRFARDKGFRVQNNETVSPAPTSNDSQTHTNNTTNTEMQEDRVVPTPVATPAAAPVATPANRPGATPNSNRSQNNQSHKTIQNSTKAMIALAVAIILLVVVGLIIGSSIRKSSGSDKGTTSGTSFSLTHEAISDQTTSTDEGKNISTDKTEEIIQEYISRANSMAEEGNYTEAFNLLESAEKQYGSSFKITNAINDIKKAQILSNIEQYEADKNYEGGIKYINESAGSFITDSDISEKLNMLKDLYRSDIIAKAEDTFYSEGYSKAIDVLNTSQSVLPNDSTISQKINEYKKYAPVSIKSFKVTDFNGYDFDDSASDPRGEVAVDVIELDYYVEFYLAGEYSKFTARIDPTQYFSPSEYQGVQLEILADDVEVYRSPTITYKTDNLDISVNIKNADYLSFKLIYVGGTKHSDHWSADPILIYNAFVSK